MKKLLALLLVCRCAFPAGAIDLKESKFTQVVNDVQVISTVDNSRSAAAIDAIFRIPDVLRTGPASRAEMVAEDRTITRVGANTIFSFDQANRSIRLEKGSLLFNSPKGKGGGNIRTTAATAAVLGTTIIVTTTPNGGFKVLTLEGRAEVSFQNGSRQRLDSGQMTFVLPGGIPGPVVMFRLDQQVAGSALVKGFGKPLAAQPRIDAAVAKQLREIKSGRAEDTGLHVGDQATATGVQVIQLFDAVSASTNGVPGVDATRSKLPPGFAVPPRLVFSEDAGGFQAIEGNGLFFVSSPARGTNPPVRVELAAGPADAALDDQTIDAPLSPSDPRVFKDSVDIFSIEPSRLLYPSFMGLIGRSIAINTPNLDLNQFAPMDHFDFLSLQDFRIGASLDIAAARLPGGVSLMAGEGHSLLFSPGTTLNVDSPSLSLVSPAGFTLDSATIRQQNAAGSLDLSSASISLNNSFISGGGVRVSSGGSLSLAGTSPTSGGISGASVTLNSASDIAIGTDVTADPATGSINAANGAGSLLVNNGATLRGASIELTSPGGLTMNNASAVGGQVDLTGDATSLSDTSITAQDVRISSRAALSATRTVPTAGQIRGDRSVTLDAGSGMTVGAGITSGTSPSTGSIGLLNRSGQLEITPGATLTAGTTTLNSPDGISVNGSTVTGTQPTLNTAAAWTAAGLATVQNSTLTLTGPLAVNSRAGIQFDTATVAGSQVSLSAGDLDEEAVGDGSINVTGSTFNLTSSMTLVNDTGVLTVGNNTRINAAGPLSATSPNGLVFDNVTASGSQVNLSSGNEAGTAAVSLQNSSLTAGARLGVEGNSVAMNNATLTAGAALSIQGGSVSLNNTVLQGDTVTVASDTFLSAPNVAPNNGRITGNSDVSISAQSEGMTIGVDVSASASSGTINMVNNGGVLNANGGKVFQAAIINVTSPGGLLFDSTTLNSGQRVSLNAGNRPGTLAVLQNTSFTGAADVNIAGHTVVLNQVDFASGSTVTLSSLLGQLAANPNSGQQVQGGFVNYIRNVNYGGAPAQDFTGPGRPITIRALP
ncbi:MAG: FecR family protein [Verrucomicrobiota bacterium]